MGVQITVVSQDIDTVTKWYWGHYSWCDWFGSFGIVFGSFILGYARNPSLKQQLFCAILGFTLSEAIGLFW